MNKIKVGDALLMSHPSSDEQYYFFGFVTSQIKKTGRFRVSIYSPKGYWGKDVIGDTIPTGCCNTMGLEVVKKVPWKKRRSWGIF